MMTRRRLLVGSAASLAAPLAPLSLRAAGAAEQASRATVLFDAFGAPSGLKRGWGYSAFIEHGGRRILFDTGGNTKDFTANASALGVDLKKLDFVALSHRHNDHTAGLNHVLRENPTVTTYTPIEGGGFGSAFPTGLTTLIKRQVVAVPDDLRYYGGNPPDENRADQPWEAHISSRSRRPGKCCRGSFSSRRNPTSRGRGR
jgi:7,8-dihydropterin-6-yl-methyl-4-(beta-D-ribofuranosyl)aminobenzene 5'-phosphate synthase